MSDPALRKQLTDELLAKLHEAVLKELLAKIESGEATPQHLNVARQFLSDNGIDAVLSANPGLQSLTDRLDSLPFPKTGS